LSLYKIKDYEEINSLVKSVCGNEIKFPLSIKDIFKIAITLKTRFNLGVSKGRTLKEFIEGKVAQCGGYVKLLAIILKEFNIHTRRINLYNYPTIGGGHSTCEFYYKGKWRYYDPSFTFFVSKTDDFDLLSLEEILKNPEYADIHGRWGMGELWPASKRKINPKKGGNINYNNGNYFTISEIFKKAYPIVILEDELPIYFPIHIKRITKIGDYSETSNSNSSSDCDSGNIQGIPAGLSYLGNSLEHRNFSFIFDTRINDTWEILIVPSYVSDRNINLTLSCAGGIIGSKEKYHPNFIGFRKSKRDIFKIIFTPYRKKAQLNINAITSGNNSYINIDAIHVKRMQN
jgi:hypothetical protein